MVRTHLQPSSQSGKAAVTMARVQRSMVPAPARLSLGATIGIKMRKVSPEVGNFSLVLMPANTILSPGIFCPSTVGELDPPFGRRCCSR
jgi:hypothetical protein